MKTKYTELTISIAIEVYKSIKDLSKEDAELLASAKLAVKQAYAPYSEFNVGAALRLANGQIHVGNNQENAAYPSGLCAERVAIYHASALYPNVAIETIAVTCKTKKVKVSVPLSPCGSCRQAISEYENKFKKPIRMIMQGETGEIYITKSIEDLLPLMFSKKFIK